MGPLCRVLPQLLSTRTAGSMLKIKCRPGQSAATYRTTNMHSLAGFPWQVRGVTKKGKEFFRFTTALTEAISQLRVVDSHIWAGCQYVHNHFIEGADKGLYMAPDKITATEVSTCTS